MITTGKTGRAGAPPVGPGSTRCSGMNLPEVLVHASFRLPGAGAGSARALALPNATALVAGQFAGAVRPLAAGRHDDPDRALGRDPALHGDRADAVIDHHAVADLHAVAVAGVAGPASGHDENAPGAVIDAAGGCRARGRCDTGQSQTCAQNGSAEPMLGP